MIPTLSIVIPVYNEEDVLPELFARLYPALDALNTPYEVIFINDGSKPLSTLSKERVCAAYCRLKIKLQSRLRIRVDRI